MIIVAAAAAVAAVKRSYPYPSGEAFAYSTPENVATTTTFFVKTNAYAVRQTKNESAFDRAHTKQSRVTCPPSARSRMAF